MDIADMADGEIEQTLEAHRAVRKPTLKPRGTCHYCEDTVGLGKLFCPGEDCRNDFEREQRIRAQQGRGDE
jgi:hypothetical protein